MAAVLEDQLGLLRQSLGVCPLRRLPRRRSTVRAPEGGLEHEAVVVQAIGSDIPTGLGSAAGAGACITGSSIGASAISPRAA